MHMIARPTRLMIKGKMPLVMPVIIGFSANLLFWSGSFIPLNPAEAEFFVYLNAAVILLGILLAVGGSAMVLLIGARQFSSAAFGGIAANSIVMTAMGLLVWGVMFSAA